MEPQFRSLSVGSQETIILVLVAAGSEVKSNLNLLERKMNTSTT